jgi:1-aminocyclopropane-1-carboxylate deaminase
MFIQGIDTANDFLTERWVQKISLTISKKKGIDVFMLRLDKIHPLISGNKWLKLDYWLKKYKSGNFRGIITAGGPWSNHLHACAYACLLEKIPMMALVKGNPSLNNAMLNDLKDWGVEIAFVNKTEFYNPEYSHLLALQQHYLFIPMGGHGAEGETGVKEWFDKQQLPHFDYILCPIGTGTTLIGISQSNQSFRELWGMDPGTGDPELPQMIENLNHPPNSKKVKWVMAGKKMGKLTTELELYMQEWYGETAIPLDFVYTAPMCQSFLKMVTDGQFTPGSSVLLIHTGGLQGNRSNGRLPVH